MDYTIGPSSDRTYILLTVRGDITRAKAMAQNREAHALGRELGIRCFLVDVTRARNIDSVVDQYDFAYTDMQRTPEIDRGARVATLVAPGDDSHDFVETVAKNSGLNMKLFTDRDEALAWLRGGSRQADGGG